VFLSFLRLPEISISLPQSLIAEEAQSPCGFWQSWTARPPDQDWAYLL